MIALQGFEKMRISFKILISPFVRLRKRITGFLRRRPHRSFRLTRRRDYKRSLKLPGLWTFNMMVNKMLWSNRRLFISLAFVYAILTIFLIGIASQDSYSSLTEALQLIGGDILSGGWGKVTQAGILFLVTATGGASANLSAVQQVYAIIIILLTWMTSVWLLRNRIAKKKVKLRDGLYSAGSPILATFIVVLVIMIQLIPIGLALFGYGAASLTILINGGVEAMMFWIAAGLLALMSIYFVTSSLFALVIVTLPGMYPFEAIKISGDLVIGRRMRIIGRILWGILTIALSWLILLVPLIIFDSWLKSVWSVMDWVPLVPVAFLALTSLTIIWASSYLYMLYREIIKDDAQPA